MMLKPRKQITLLGNEFIWRLIDLFEDEKIFYPVVILSEYLLKQNMATGSVIFEVHSYAGYNVIMLKYSSVFLRQFKKSENIVENHERKCRVTLNMMRI